MTVIMTTHDYLIVLDGHVHIYDCFDMSLFLDAVFRKFSMQTDKQGAANTFIGILILTEASGVN